MYQYVLFYIIAYNRLLLLIISGLVKTVVLLFTGLTYCVEPGLTKIDASKTMLFRTPRNQHTSLLLLQLKIHLGLYA